MRRVMTSLGWLLLVLTLVGLAAAETLYVSPDANLTPGNCSFSSPCNLSSAYSVVSPGDTLALLLSISCNFSFPMTPIYLRDIAFVCMYQTEASGNTILGTMLTLENVTMSNCLVLQFQYFQSLILRDIAVNGTGPQIISTRNVTLAGNITSVAYEYGITPWAIQGSSLLVSNATLNRVSLSLSAVDELVIVESFFTYCAFSVTGACSNVTMTDVKFLWGEGIELELSGNSMLSVGGALNFGVNDASDEGASCESISFENVTIESSSAEIGGGAFWDYSAIPSCVPSSGLYFFSNVAGWYGNNAASLPYQLVADANAPSRFVYAGLPFDIRLTVQDYFNNAISSDYFSYSVSLSCNGCILGEYSAFTDENGVAYFPGVLVTPNGTSTISIVAKSRFINNIPQYSPVKEPTLVMNLTLHCGLNQAIDVSEANYGQCSPCPPYSYCFVNGGTCLPCPFRMDGSPCVFVNDSGLILSGGAWPAPSYLSPKQLIDCYWQNAFACQESLCNFSNLTGDLSCQTNCAAGYENFACSKCSPSYYRVDTGCLPCSASRRFGIVTGVICGSLLLSTTLALTFLGEQASKIYLILELLLLMFLFFFELAEVWFLELVALLSITYLFLLFVRGKKKTLHSIAGLLKITVFFAQTTFVVIGPVLPDSFSWLISILSHVVPHIHVIGLECFSEIFTPGSWTHVSFVWLFPVFLMTPIVSIMLLRRLRVALLPRASDGLKQRWREEFLHAIIWILNTVHFEICLSILSNFTCSSFYLGDNKRVVAYPWVECFGDSYDLLSQTAILGVVLYLGVWPLIVFVVLIYPIVMQNSSLELPWYLIIFEEGYRKERSWYEVVWLIRRLILAILVSMISSVNDSRVALITALVLFTLVHLYLQPFSTDWQNRLECLSLLAVITSLSTLSIGPSVSFDWLGQLLLLVVFVILSLAFMSILWSTAAKFLSKFPLLKLFVLEPALQEEELLNDDEGEPLLRKAHAELPLLEAIEHD